MAELLGWARIPKAAHESPPPTAKTVSPRDAIEKRIKRHASEAVANRFGELPFLFKVLCAAQPLSIQVRTRINATRKSVS